MTQRSAMEIRDAEHQLQIIEEERNKCPTAYRNEPVINASGTFCPTLWDTLSCWHATRAGEVAVKPCPSYIHNIKLQAYASKNCTEEGRWYTRSDGWHWTNYSDCNRTLQAPNVSYLVSNVSYIEDYIPTVKLITRVGSLVSLVTLVIALFVLATNKRLRCPRNIVHMHLFVSFVLRAFVVLLKDFVFEGFFLPSNIVHLTNGRTDIDDINGDLLCRFITCMWNYCRMANYSWILMEGLYLHNLIFLALFSDTSSITLYVILGWGLPVLFLLPWIGLRIALAPKLCWLVNIEAPNVVLMIEIPITISIMVNTGFFVNIVRVLLHKIKATFVEKPQTYRKWAKSTLVLVPLFGIHFIIFLGMNLISHEKVNPLAEIVWLYFDQFFTSFQGFLVAVLYFFLNGEVKSEMNKVWQNIRRKRPSGRKLSAFAKSSSIHGTYCTTASCASLNSLKWGNSKVGQPPQLMNDKKITQFYPQVTETTRLNSYGNFNAVNSEENEWSRPGENANNIELGCLIP